MLPSQTETYPLTDPGFLENPYPVYRRMRQQDPVYWSEALGHWVLTRYDDVLAATRHPALSSAITEVSVRAQLRGSDPALAADYTRVHAGMMLMKDGPEHHRLRVLGNHAFTRSALQRWQAVKAKVLPRPGALSTLICPPMRATSRAAIVRPRPVPPYFRLAASTSS